MANILNKAQCTMGRVLIVENIERLEHPRSFKYGTQAKRYVCIHVEDEIGTDEFPILLTEKEYAKISKMTVASKMATGMTKGRLYTVIKSDNSIRYVVHIWEGTGDIVLKDIVLMLTELKLKNFRKRAEAHDKSIPKKGVLRNLFD